METQGGHGTCQKYIDCDSLCHVVDLNFLGERGLASPSSGAIYFSLSIQDTLVGSKLNVLLLKV